MHFLSQTQLCSSTHLGHWTAPLELEGTSRVLVGEGKCTTHSLSLPNFSKLLWERSNHRPSSSARLPRPLLVWNTYLLGTDQRDSFHWDMETHFKLTVYLHIALGFSTNATYPNYKITKNINPSTQSNLLLCHPQKMMQLKMFPHIFHL